MQRLVVTVIAVLIAITALASMPVKGACPTKSDNKKADNKTAPASAATQKPVPGDLNLDFCDLPEAVLKLDDVKVGKKPEWDSEAYNRINLGRDSEIDHRAGGPNESWFDKRSGDDLKQVSPGQKKPFITFRPNIGAN